MSAVVVVGSSSMNVIVEVDSLPEPRPHTITAKDHWRTLGGTSAGKSLHLADVGLSVTCATPVGADEDGEAICAELRRAGVNVMPLTGSGPSEHHLNLMTDRGERLSIYLDHAPTVELTARQRGEIEAEFAAARIIALDLAQLCVELIEPASRAAAPLWVDLHDYDGVNRFHGHFIPHADVLLMNGDGIADPVEFLRGRVALGLHAGVCTLGADGAVGVASDGEIVHVDAVPVDVVDTNGAGDAFTAGMMASVLRHDATGPLDATTLREAMTAGAIQSLAALTSRGLGPQSQR